MSFSGQFSPTFPSDFPTVPQTTQHDVYLLAIMDQMGDSLICSGLLSELSVFCSLGSGKMCCCSSAEWWAIFVVAGSKNFGELQLLLESELNISNCFCFLHSGLWTCNGKSIFIINNMTMSQLLKAIYFYQHKYGFEVVNNSMLFFFWLQVDSYLTLFSEKKHCFQT